MYLEDYETELDFNDYVDHSDGEILDLSDDDGYEMKFKSKSAGTTLPSDFEEEDTSAYNHVTGAAVEIRDQSQIYVGDEKPFTIPVDTPTTTSKRSKSDIAKEIYEREMKKGPVVRKNILKLFETEALLTKAGAATYYNLIHSKHK